MYLKKEENIFEIEIKNAQKQGKKVYILGAALGGRRIAGGLKYRGLEFDAFIVDSEYYEAETTFLGKNVYCIDEVIGENCIIICSIANYPKMNQLKDKACVVDEDVLSLSMVASEPFDRKFVMENMDRLDALYDSLQDQKSRQVMQGYLNQKLTGRFIEMSEVWNQLEYFDGDFYDLENVNCIVDCGAFIGDSFLAFCDEYKKRKGMKFEGIAYLLDPDESNQRQIKINCEMYKNHIKQLQIGAWFEKSVLSFQSDENMRTAGKIVESGNIQINVDKIDNIVKENKVDFIKMDIEGSELNALRGAANAIRRDHPILAICVYHKRQDLLEIPAYISELYSEYKFYLRAYGGPYTNELVLYAIAN